MSALHLNAHLKVESKTKTCKPFPGKKGGEYYLKVFLHENYRSSRNLRRGKKRKSKHPQNTNLFKMFVLSENTKAVMASVTQCNSHVL